MKKFIPLPIVMAFMLLAGGFFAPAQPQNPTDEEKPTFYRLTPGVYVNGWPRFTVTYPKDWVERPPLTFGGEVFRASPPGPARYPASDVVLVPWPQPLDRYAETDAGVMRNWAQEVTILGDKPSQLRDGTPAREVELKMVRNGQPINRLTLATKKGDLLIHVDIGSTSGMKEDLKAIPYSLEFQPGKDEPVRVPSDVQEFLGSWRNAIVSHDVVIVVAHYSDRYLNSGVRKGEIERFWRQFIGPVTSLEVGITDFLPAGDRVYLTGFVINNFGKFPITDTSIINENGEWKWYGNQRTPVP